MIIKLSNNNFFSLLKIRMHNRMSPHGDFDHMSEAINLVNNFKAVSIMI